MRAVFISIVLMAKITILIGLSGIGAFAQSQFPDTLWVPVIFYDYHADGKADFETCEDPLSNVGRKGMVTRVLDAQRKPVPIPAVACPAVGASFPCACHLSEWFRVSGSSGSDNAAVFSCDSVTDPEKPKWSWTGLVPYQSRRGEYVGSNYNAAYSMANVIVYDSLRFRLVPNSAGVYQFVNDDFLPLDGRGFGNEPPVPTDAHNFGFTMEMHTKFKYQKGLSFSFRGDDDVWAFIDGKLAMDLGGTHYYMDGYINLDTVAGLVPGQTYSFDLYYAERHSTGSHIRITSNVISASPSKVDIKVFPSDTIAAGDTALIIGTVTDEKGKALPVLSDSIRWSQNQSNVKEGDRIVVVRNDSTKFTATAAYRRIGIIGTFRSGTNSIIDTTWIYIKPAAPSQIDIDQQSATALVRTDAAAKIDTFNVRPQQTITLTMGQNAAYAYAVLRDRFGNFCVPADSASWASQNTAVATVKYSVNNAFEGTVNRPQGVLNGTTNIVVSQGALRPDTARIVLVADTLLMLRLVDVANPNVSLDTVTLNPDGSVVVKVQGIWSTAPGVWVDVTGSWSLYPADAVKFSIPVPTTTTGQWNIDPSSSGITRLTVNSLNASVSLLIIVRSITKLRLVNITVPDRAVSVISMTTDSTLTLKLQGVWSDDSATWVDLGGVWSLNPANAVTFSVPLPAGDAIQWKLAPSSGGNTKIIVVSHGVAAGVSLFVTVADLQGPYVKTAVFTPGPLGKAFDTLRVTFSEPVLCDSLKKVTAPASSFRVSGPGNVLKTTVFDGSYYTDGGVCATRYITGITIITKAKVNGIIPGKDSIVLYGSTVDTAGNHPDAARRGPIVYGPGAGITILAYKNSDDIATSMIVPPEVLARFDIGEQASEGKLILLQTRAPLKSDTLPDGRVTYGTTVIYDAVGNLVASGLPIRPSLSDDRLYCVFWNGANRSKRWVASGAYLLRVTVRYVNDPEKPVHQQTKFSIRRGRG